MDSCRQYDQDVVRGSSNGGGGCPVFRTIVSWRSRRHKSRCLSSMEAEYMEASEASKEVIFFRELMKDVDCEMSAPTVLYEDNKACMAFSKNNTNHDRSKHIDIRAYAVALRDTVRNGVIELVHIDTKNQLADMLTKHQRKATFIDHVERIFSAQAPKFNPRKVKCARARVNMCGCLSCFVGGA